MDDWLLLPKTDGDPVAPRTLQGDAVSGGGLGPLAHRRLAQGRNGARRVARTLSLSVLPLTLTPPPPTFLICGSDVHELPWEQGRRLVGC